MTAEAQRDTIRSITPPSDFPVTWQRPEDTQQHWTRDREHMPEPITPMVHSVVSRLAEEARARAQRHRDKVGAVAMRIGELWANTWRPDIEAHFRFWDSFDLEGADWPLVHAHLEETLIRAGRLRDLHSLFGPPMWFAIHEFETFYCDLFPPSTRLDAHRRLQGFDNKTRAWPRAVALEPAGSSVAGCATHPD